MPNWTQQELEELLAEMTKKAMTDAEFRKEVLADATKALEKLAGRPLPEGASIKCIEKDPNYQSTFVLPDLIDEERLEDVGLRQVAGGINYALIISFCAVAVGSLLDIGACGAKACVADMCMAEAAGAVACAAKSSLIESPCRARVCALDTPNMGEGHL